MLNGIFIKYIIHYCVENLFDLLLDLCLFVLFHMVLLFKFFLNKFFLIKIRFNIIDNFFFLQLVVKKKIYLIYRFEFVSFQNYFNYICSVNIFILASRNDSLKVFYEYISIFYIILIFCLHSFPLSQFKSNLLLILIKNIRWINKLKRI